MTVLVPKIETKLYFYWSDVECAIATEMGCDASEFRHTFHEWRNERDPEAGNDEIGAKHNFDRQIEELEAKIRIDVEESGEYDDLDDDELEDAITDNYYRLPFLKAIKKVLGEHSTSAAFLYSW